MKKTLLLLFVFINFFLVSAFAASTNILIISDIHLDKTSTHVMDISPTGFNNNNDLDETTYCKLLDVLGKKYASGTKPAAIFVLGDLVGHDEPMDKVMMNEKEVFTQINQLSQRIGNVPVFYVFGNNDSLTANYGPFQNKDTKQSVYDVAKSTGWADGFLSTGTQCGGNSFPCLLTEDKDNGYYSAYLQPKLKLIALNSVMFSAKRSGVTEQDAQKQLAWFEAQLKDAQSAQDAVVIAMHIPPGFNVFDHSVFWVDSDNTRFLQIVNTYKNIITGILTSHTHMEEMKVVRSKEDNKVAAVVFTAGLSTSHGNSPSAKQIYFGQQNGKWALANFDTLQFSENADKSLAVNKLYDFAGYYCTVKSANIRDCLDNFNVDKMRKYYTVYNPNFMGSIKSPDDIYLQVTQ
jgi:hypothetical protein